MVGVSVDKGDGRVGEKDAGGVLGDSVGDGDEAEVELEVDEGGRFGFEVEFGVVEFDVKGKEGGVFKGFLGEEFLFGDGGFGEVKRADKYV